MKNCFIQNNFNPNAHQLIFTWKGNSIKNILLLFCRRELDNLHGKKNWPLLANLSEVIFIEGQCHVAFGIDQFVLILNICL